MCPALSKAQRTEERRTYFRTQDCRSTGVTVSSCITAIYGVRVIQPAIAAAIKKVPCTIVIITSMRLFLIRKAVTNASTGIISQSIAFLIRPNPQRPHPLVAGIAMWGQASRPSYIGRAFGEERGYRSV